MASLTQLSSRTVSRFKNTVLGRDFDLSVAYVSRQVIQRLNRERRGIDAPTDILSFQLSDTSGELILCLPEVVAHAREWQMPAPQYLKYLFIHGMVHVQGHDHGRIMDGLETRHCKALNVLRPTSPVHHGRAHRSRH